MPRPEVLGKYNVYKVNRHRAVQNLSDYKDTLEVILGLLEGVQPRTKADMGNLRQAIITGREVEKRVKLNSIWKSEEQCALDLPLTKRLQIPHSHVHYGDGGQIVVVVCHSPDCEA